MKSDDHASSRWGPPSSARSSGTTARSRRRAAARLLLHQGPAAGCDLVVFPELALTTFFPRWYTEDQAEIDAWFETEMPSPATKPLFDEAARARRRLLPRLRRADPPTAPPLQQPVLVERDGSTVATFRKVHIPGHEENEPWRPFQHLERHYFEPGPDGFGVWRAFGGLVGMMICNDRRWPESYRVMGLQGVELILCGYNTPIHYAPDPSQDILQGFHNALVMQAGAYQNGTWVVGVAKGGVEEGVDALAQSCIIAPSGPDRGPGLHDRRRAGRRPLRPRLVPALQGHAVRLRPLPPARGVQPHHRRSAAWSGRS